MEETIIIEGCKRQEQSAQRLFYDSFYNYVYTIAFRYLNNHHDSQDVVLISFNKIFKNIHKVENQQNGGLKKWVQTIAINESLRFLKKRNPVEYTEDDQMFDRTEEEDEPEMIYDAKVIKEIINKMPEGYKRIFLLKTVDGLTHAEIANHLSISTNTSKSQMLKARKYLQLQLRNYETERT